MHHSISIHGLVLNEILSTPRLFERNGGLERGVRPRAGEQQIQRRRVLVATNGRRNSSLDDLSQRGESGRTRPQLT